MKTSLVIYYNCNLFRKRIKFFLQKRKSRGLTQPKTFLTQGTYVGPHAKTNYVPSFSTLTCDLEVTMKSFAWKRKAGENVNKTQVTAFSAESKDEHKDSDDSEVDWLTLAPKRQYISLEDTRTKSERLKQEGAVLAEAERYWEALKKWDEALQLTQNNVQILEMKAQALMALGEVFPAVQAAEKTVEIAPYWWVAHQTLGRALVNVGEVRMALKSFSRAVHLNPSDQELWVEDLIWAKSLLERKKSIAETERVQSTLTLTEITEDKDQGQQSLLPYNSQSCPIEEDSTSEVKKHIKRLPKNYVQMRDLL